MASVNLKELISKLNPLCKRSLEGAAGLCLSRTNYNVEIEHFLTKLIEASNSDVIAILKAFSIEPSRLSGELTRAIDRFKTGNARPPALSQNVLGLIREAWMIASVDYRTPLVRSGHILTALICDEELSRLARSISSEFDKINGESLRKSLMQIIGDTGEAAESAPAMEQAATASGMSGGGAAGGPGKPGGPSKTPSLDQFTIDLTDRAKKGGIDPVLGRDAEIRQIIDVLLRRRQNNPILTGEAGVGKTAVVEGFALRIVAGDVPPALKGVQVRSLDLGLLQAGAGVKGEFENRLKSVIDEVKSSSTPIIMFIDEAHTMIGAGGSEGQNDAANLLKPALARGELRTIAATTWSEYKQYFEKDAALVRRFQVVKVEEPDEKVAVAMIGGLVATLEKHHKVRILSEAVEDAVKLSHRYISGRQLPDKAVSLLDTTCARIGLSQHATPPQLEDCDRTITGLKTSIGILERESLAGADHAEAIEAQKKQLAATEEKLVQLKQRWEEEKALVSEVAGLRAQLEGSAAPAAASAEAPKPVTPADRDATLAKLKDAQDRLTALQGDSPLVHVCVDSSAIAETVAAWTGIPVGKMVADEVKTVLNLKNLMEEVVVGQSHALDLIAKSIQTSRANLTDPVKPIGVFLLAGTSGVGKTETAITLANLLYGGEQNMTTINMSEFKEEHKVSLLMGSPPGYVGFGKGGVLTEAVRRKPYSVVLLDELEKAHPGFQDVFYQVFDKGMMRDSEGRDINFRNTVILMTTNAGTDYIKSICADPETMPDPEKFGEAVFPELLKTFKPAFLGRCKIIPYYPLSDEVMSKIIELKLGKVARRVKEHYGASFNWTPELVKAVCARCTEVDTGARNVDNILNKTVLPELSNEFLSRMADGRTITAVKLDVGEDGQFTYEL